ncbi:hypothetical protein BBAD15_g11662 [Beauveria bassiana D1-5]|uniref:Uncharacterized protein n=1 Tax=Beauveria bassiana D1-5 TaxID=1245745 RepID=A0A0A2V5P6_BEABA|nr:hypothetical protein BBAD15_g11662 [Beauveria bassiana D1-5]
MATQQQYGTASSQISNANNSSFSLFPNPQVTRPPPPVIRLHPNPRPKRSAERERARQEQQQQLQHHQQNLYTPPDHSTDLKTPSSSQDVTTPSRQRTAHHTPLQFDPVPSSSVVASPQQQVSTMSGRSESANFSPADAVARNGSVRCRLWTAAAARRLRCHCRRRRRLVRRPHLSDPSFRHEPVTHSPGRNQSAKLLRPRRREHHRRPRVHDRATARAARAAAAATQSAATASAAGHGSLFVFLSRPCAHKHAAPTASDSPDQHHRPAQDVLEGSQWLESRALRGTRLLPEAVSAQRRPRIHAVVGLSALLHAPSRSHLGVCSGLAVPARPRQDVQAPADRVVNLDLDLGLEPEHGRAGAGVGARSESKHWQQVLRTTLEEESRKHPPNDGLVALLMPDPATKMAVERADEPSLVAMAERECARLVWDEDSASNYLVHPALAAPFCVTVDRCPWSRVEYTLEHHESPRHLAKLTRDGTGGGWLEVDTSVAAHIEAYYIIDVAVTALLLVAAADERSGGYGCASFASGGGGGGGGVGMETFEPPPALAEPRPTAAGGGDARRGSGRFSRLSIIRREDNNNKKKKKKKQTPMEQFEMDLESQDGSLTKSSTRVRTRSKRKKSKEKEDKLPFLVRAGIKVAKGTFKCIIWILTAVFRVLFRCVRSKY